MKKSIKLVFLFLLMSNLLIAQDANEDTQTPKPHSFDYNNEVAFEILGLIDGQFLFSYERAIGENFSVKLGVGFKTEDGLIKLSGIDRPNLTSDELTYDGFKVIPEVRYYINKSQNRKLDGFYFGAYLKHSNFKNDFNSVWTDSNDIQYDVVFNAKYTVNSVGLMIGYKLPIGKHFVLDFLIAGPGAGSYNFKLKNSQDLPQEFYDDLNEALEDYFESIDIDFDLSSVDEKLDFTFPSFRYGISLGYQF